MNNTTWNSTDHGTRPGYPWTEMLNVEEDPLDRRIPGIEISVPAPRTRQVFVSPPAQTSEAVGVLSKLDFVQHLCLTFWGETRLLCAFPPIASLESFALHNASIDEGLLGRIVKNTAIKFFKLQGVKYNGSFECLSELKDLRDLEVRGSVPRLSRECEFLDSLPALTCAILEMNNLTERAVEALSRSPARMMLTLSGVVDPATMSAVSSVTNLVKLTFERTYFLGFPHSFRKLHRLKEVSFRNTTIRLEEIRGLQNLPSSVFALSVDYDCWPLPSLRWIPEQLKTQITRLSVKAPIFGQGICLSKCSGLTFIEICAKKEADPEVLRELRNCPRLTDVSVGGGLNLEAALRKHLPCSNLSSFEVSNELVTPEALAGIRERGNLKNVAFHCCVFPFFDIDNLKYLQGVENLMFDRCYPTEHHLVDILSSPYVRNAKAIQFKLSSLLPREEYIQVRTIQQELGLEVAIEYHLE